MLLQKYESRLELEDLRHAGEPIEVTFLGELTAAQRQAAKAIVAHDNGVVVALPGFGKTVLGHLSDGPTQVQLPGSGT